MKYPEEKFLTKQYKEILLSIVLKYLPTAKIYLFGSRACNEHRQGSDIDIQGYLIKNSALR